MKKNLICLHLLSFLAFSLFGADTPKKGVFTGRIFDESTESPLIAVSVMIEGTALGTAANNQGNFYIENIPPGLYDVRFAMIGYETRVISNVVINPGKTTTLDIYLKSTVLETEGVQVSAGYFHEAKDAVVSNRSVDYEEIRMDPGSAEDIQRVMQALPAVVSGSDQYNEIIVRGGIPGENLFLMDNIEIPNPNHFAHQGSGGGPINMINTNFVRQVDFYAGAFPARYGDKASSVMDISLRDGNQKEYAGNAYLGMAGAGILFEGPIQNGKGSFITSFRKSFLDLIISSTGLTAVPHYYNLQGKLSYNLNPNNKLIVNGIYGNDNIFIENDEGEGGYSRGAENVDARYYQYAIGMTWRHLYSDKGFMKLTLSQALNHYNEYVWEDINTPVYDNFSTETERTIRAEWTFLPDKALEFNFGGNAKSIPVHLKQWADADTIFQYRYDPSIPHWTYLGIYRAYDVWQTDFETTTSKAALFGQTKWHLLPRTTISAGLRWEYFDLIHQSAVDPRLGLSYSFNPGTQINLAYGQHHQSPAYIDVTANPANTDLQFKRTRQIVLGFERLLREDIRGTFEVYYKTYHDVPVFLASSTSDPYDAYYGRMINAGKGYAKGLEFFLQKKSSENYHFTISYSYSISKATDPRNGAEYNWDYDFRHIFTLISGWKFSLFHKAWYQNLKHNFWYQLVDWMLPLGDQVDISIRWRYLGGRPYTERTYVGTLRNWIIDAETPLNGLRYPAYHRLDLRIDKRYMFNGWNMVTYFDIMNVYNRDNIWEYSYNSDGEVKRILQYQTFPVGGITIEF